jgi:hypothetical protein
MCVAAIYVFLFKDPQKAYIGMAVGCGIIILATFITLIVEFRATSHEKQIIDHDIEENRLVIHQEEGEGSVQIHPEPEVRAPEPDSQHPVLEPQVIRPASRSSAKEMPRGTTTKNLAAEIEANLAEQFDD